MVDSRPSAATPGREKRKKEVKRETLEMEEGGEGQSRRMLLDSIAEFLEIGGFSRTTPVFRSEANLESDGLGASPINFEGLFCKFMESRISKRRNVEGNSSRGKHANSLIWYPAMEDKLVDAFLHQSVIGNRINGMFTTAAYNQIVAELVESFPNKPFDKVKVKNRMKYMKSKWAACYDVFKNGGSGFTWSRSTNMWSAEPEVWDRLIQANPEAAEWRTKAIPNYDKLSELFAADRANGEHAEPVAEGRETRAFSAINEMVPFTIDGIDDMLPREEILLESFDGINNQQPNGKEDEHQTTVETKPTANSQKKNRKSEDVSIEQEMIKSMNRVAEAMELSAFEYSRSRGRAPMEEVDVWNHLVELGVEDDKIDNAYLLLTEKPEKLRCLLGCPFERRKNLLRMMLHRASMAHQPPH